MVTGFLSYTYRIIIHKYIILYRHNIAVNLPTHNYVLFSKFNRLKKTARIVHLHNTGSRLSRKLLTHLVCSLFASVSGYTNKLPDEY